MTDLPQFRIDFTGINRVTTVEGDELVPTLRDWYQNAPAGVRGAEIHIQLDEAAQEEAP